MYSRTITKSAEYRALLPTLLRVEHTLKGNQIARDISIFKDFTSGLYTYESLGLRYNNLRGSRISQIVRSIEHQIKNPNAPNPIMTDQTMWRRNRKIYELYCTGEYSFADLGKKFNLGDARVSQIIKDVTHNEELRRSREAFNEPLISDMVNHRA